MPDDLFPMNRRRTGAHRETVHRIANCLRRRFSIASFVLRSGCGLPVTATGVPLQTPHWSTHICINRSSLSADKGRCQAHFFFTTFCVARPLAKSARSCSTQQICDAIRTRESTKVSVVVHYHARFRERSMREDGNHEKSHAKARRRKGNYHKEHKEHKAIANKTNLLPSSLCTSCP